jgi:3-oxoacyl-[acyl-carrier protein] reductase
MTIAGICALVTGGSRGIGRATVELLVACGARVLFTYRTGKKEADELVSSLGVEALPCDVRDPQGIDQLVAAVQERGLRPDILVNNAGTPIRGGFEDASAAQWQEAFDLHVRAPALLSKAFAPGMKEKRGGVIVNIGSVAGMRGVAGTTLYCAVKGAVIAMTRAMARDLAEFNVRALCVSPGIIRTDFHKSMTPEAKTFNEQKRIPLHREGTPQEVAQLIVSLIEIDYCTGDNYVVDGGLTMRIV